MRVFASISRGICEKPPQNADASSMVPADSERAASSVNKISTISRLFSSAFFLQYVVLLFHTSRITAASKTDHRVVLFRVPFVVPPCSTSKYVRDRIDLGYVMKRNFFHSRKVSFWMIIINQSKNGLKKTHWWLAFGQIARTVKWSSHCRREESSSVLLLLTTELAYYTAARL